MKIRYFIIVSTIIIATLTSLTVSINKKFYYSFDKKTYLIPKKNALLVKYAEEFDKNNEEEYLKNSSPGVEIKWIDSKIAKITATSEESKNTLNAKLKLKKEVYICQPFYTLEDGSDMGVTDEILLKFLVHVSQEQQNALHKKYKTKVIKKTKIYQKLLISKGEDALEIANKYYESGLVKFSTPKFISKFEYSQVYPNDTYFSKQITCHNTGQVFNDGHSGTYDADIDAPEAWEITTGCNSVVIAVLDQGITSDHPDLPNIRQVRLDGSNFGGGFDNNPSPTGDENHGNACAGVIAATMNNNEGIAGIAPNCRIMPIRLPDNPQIDPEGVADAIEFAVNNGADILSNSWGYQNEHLVIIEAINYALDNDCVVIFAAGNTANHENNYNGYVEFPANVNIPGVIAVGASDRDDQQANYSPTNILIDITAPSHRAFPNVISGETLEMWSIDIPEDAGYNPYPFYGMPHPPVTGESLPNNPDYTGRFGGTSHSCPVVAGVAALMLSINPNLSYMDVFNILTSSADKVGGYTYINGHCDEMGYGRVNAFEALKAVYPISGPSTVCNYNNATFNISNLPAGSTINWTNSINMSYVSGQGTNTYEVERNSSGSAWVEANISGVSCDVVSIRKYFTDGRPIVTDSQIRGGYDNVSFNSIDNFSITAASGASSYSWSIVPYLMSCSSDKLPYFISSNTGTSVSVKHGTCEGKYLLRCIAVNSCGSNYYQDKVINVYDPFGDNDPCDATITLYPNPGKNNEFTNLKIQYPDDPCDEEVDSYMAVDIEHELNLYDLSGNLILQDNFTSDTYTFKNANLKKDIYILTLKDKKGKLHQERLKIK
jgi:subtilisin family serine protease